MKRHCLNLTGLCILLIGTLILSACGESQAHKIQRYINGLGRKGTPNTREVYMKLLIQQGDVAVGPLIRALEMRKDYMVRTYAATTLARMGAREAVGPIRAAMLNDDNAEVRGSAILAYAELAGLSALPDLISLLRTDKAVAPRNSARQALANLGQPAIDDLIPLLQDPNAIFRKDIRKTLILIGRPAVPQLIAALSEQNDAFIVEVFRTLAAIGDTSALMAMKTTMQRYPAWDDPVSKRIKNEMYRTLEGYYNDLRNK